MHQMVRVIAVAAGLMAHFDAAASGQTAPDLPVSAAERAAVIDGVARKLVTGYVFADRAAFIQQQLARKSAHRLALERLLRTEVDEMSAAMWKEAMSELFPLSTSLVK